MHNTFHGIYYAFYESNALITKLVQLPKNLPIVVHALLLLVSVVALKMAKTTLDVSYAASKHPVDFVTGQTGFNGETLKGYYATMESYGTLDIYWRTQFIDFSFIVGVFLVGLFSSSLLLRFTRMNGYASRVAQAAGVFLIGGALCDAMENLISFVMLSRHDSFANWIALPYSGFAVVKFLLMGLGMVSLLFGIVLLVYEKLRS